MKEMANFSFAGLVPRAFCRNVLVLRFGSILAAKLSSKALLALILRYLIIGLLPGHLAGLNR
jgi:hypothetical protein